MQKGYTILEHPSDIGIAAKGSSLAAAFQNAALGLMSVILDLTSVEAKEVRELEITAMDSEHLLVKWLSEILYLFDGKQFVCKEFVIKELGQTHLLAIIKGEEFAENKHKTILDVKAITYHQLLVKNDEEGGLVKVFLDI